MNEVKFIEINSYLDEEGHVQNASLDRHPASFSRNGEVRGISVPTDATGQSSSDCLHQSNSRDMEYLHTKSLWQF